MDWGKKPAKYFRRTPTTFFIIQSRFTQPVFLSRWHRSLPPYHTALQAFRDQYGANPSRFHENDTDSTKLLELKQEVTKRCNISSDLIPEDFTSSCYSELSPVCAVVGGVLGQEIIKVCTLIPHSSFPILVHFGWCIAN